MSAVEQTGIPIRLPTATQDWLQTSPAVKATFQSDLTGFSTGTGLAIALNELGAGMRPVRTPEGQIEYEIKPLDQMKDAWPMGWEPKAEVPRDRITPYLFQQGEVGFEKSPLVEVLAAIATESKTPIVIDTRRSLLKKVDVSQIQVSYPQRKVAWALVVSQCVREAKLYNYYRQDEAAWLCAGSSLRAQTRRGPITIIRARASGPRFPGFYAWAPAAVPHFSTAANRRFRSSIRFTTTTNRLSPGRLRWTRPPCKMPFSGMNVTPRSRVEQLTELLRIPSVSAQSTHNADTRRAAEFVLNQLKAAGLKTELCETPGHPIVYGEWLGAPGAPTVMVYGHYDVQPPDPLDKWETPPFEPTIRGGHIYARERPTTKVRCTRTCARSRRGLSRLGKLPVNVKFVIEGEEEVGSNHLESSCRRTKNAAGTTWRSSATPASTAGRGCRRSPMGCGGSSPARSN